MNERIKELKKQAWDYAMAVHDGHVVPPADKAVWPMDEVFDEKFAELIVKECCDKIESEYKYALGEKTQWAMSQDVQDLLKDHFGVEE